jgi:hypothetical protein
MIRSLCSRETCALLKSYLLSPIARYSKRCNSWRSRKLRPSSSNGFIQGGFDLRPVELGVFRPFGDQHDGVCAFHGFQRVGAVKSAQVVVVTAGIVERYRVGGGNTRPLAQELAGDIQGLDVFSLKFQK